MRALWSESQQLENADDFEGAARLRARVAELRPQDANARWRIARDLMHAAGALSASDREGRMRLFEESQSWAREGAALEPSCGECCLYEFAATAQLAKTAGLAGSVGHVKRAGEVLERCLTVPPTWSEPRWGHERAQLYYGAAAYYRMLPESAWARWVLGLHGDSARAVELARRATLVAPAEPAYRVELGAALLCHERRSGTGSAGEEGRRVLSAIDLQNGVEPSVRARATQLLAQPAEACDDSEHGRVSWH